MWTYDHVGFCLTGSVLWVFFLWAFVPIQKFVKVVLVWALPIHLYTTQCTGTFAMECIS